MYFGAIVCPAELDDRIGKYKLWMKQQFGCMVALKSPAHITLVPPFWLAADKESELLVGFSNFQSDMDAVEVELNGFSHFGKRVLYANVVANPALEELQQQTAEYFVQLFPDEIKKDERPFHPHITIATRDMKPSAFQEAWEEFSKKQLIERFTVTNISLLKLVVGKWKTLAEKCWVMIE